MTSRTLKISVVILSAGLLASCESYTQPVTEAVSGWYGKAKNFVTGEEPDYSDSSYIVRQVGQDLEESDAKLIADTAAKTLENEPAGRAIRWDSPETDASARIVAGKTVMERRPVKAARNEGVLEAPLSTVIGRTYMVKRPVNLRLGPGTEHPVVRLMPQGEMFTALAKVANRRWFLIGHDGQAIGYVYAPLTKPAKEGTVAVQLRDPQGESSHDGNMAAAEGAAIMMTANTPCRTLKYTVRTRSDNPRKNRFRACKAVDGAWDIATPLVADSGN